MQKRARRNEDEVCYANVEFREYAIFQERIPVDDYPGCLIINNDVSKLTTDKISVVKETPVFL
jgi:hypothetical protein